MSLNVQVRFDVVFSYWLASEEEDESGVMHSKQG